MAITVHKYGGSSLATFDRVHRAAHRITGVRQAGDQVVVVVSARGDTTDELIRLAIDAGGARLPRELDQLLATGECVSAALMAMVLNGMGVPAVSMTGWQAGIRAAGRHGSALIAAVETGRLTRALDTGQVVVVAGFQGLNAGGDIVTLGRGGSDTTAVALAAELGAAHCEIYTDVDGVYTADPRVVPGARHLPGVDVGVMAEMAFAGARVLHARSVELAAMAGMEVRVRSSFTGHPGTVIRGGSDQEMLESRGVLVAIAHDVDVARVLVKAGKDLAAEVLSALGDRSVPVDLVARSGPHEEEFRMGFTIRRSDIEEVRTLLERTVTPHEGHVVIQDNVGKVSLVGMGLLNRPQYIARMLSRLSADGIATSWIATSQLRISVVVPHDNVIEAVKALHDEFGLDREELSHAA